MKNVTRSVRLLAMTAVFTLAGFAVAAVSQAPATDIAIHLTCSGSVGYGGVIIGGDAYHTYCEISESYSGVIIRTE